MPTKKKIVTIPEHIRVSSDAVDQMQAEKRNRLEVMQKAQAVVMKQKEQEKQQKAEVQAKKRGTKRKRIQEAQDFESKLKDACVKYQKLEEESTSKDDWRLKSVVVAYKRAVAQIQGEIRNLESNLTAANRRLSIAKKESDKVKVNPQLLEDAKGVLESLYFSYETIWGKLTRNERKKHRDPVIKKLTRRLLKI